MVEKSETLHVANGENRMIISKLVDHVGGQNSFETDRSGHGKGEYVCVYLGVLIKDFLNYHEIMHPKYIELSFGP